MKLSYNKATYLIIIIIIAIGYYILLIKIQRTGQVESLVKT